MNNIEIIFKREAPAFIHNDGKQTATATCCRECIRKWHKIQPGKELSRIQQNSAGLFGRCNYDMDSE